ncbi:hypothetical protein ACVXG9_22580 [Escherichia coli]
MVIELTAASDFNKFIGVLIQTHGKTPARQALKEANSLPGLW